MTIILKIVMWLRLWLPKTRFLGDTLYLNSNLVQNWFFIISSLHQICCWLGPHFHHHHHHHQHGTAKDYTQGSHLNLHQDKYDQQQQGKDHGTHGSHHQCEFIKDHYYHNAIHYKTYWIQLFLIMALWIFWGQAVHHRKNQQTRNWKSCKKLFGTFQKPLA